MLQKQVFSVAIDGGLDSKSDSKWVPSGKALALDNARFLKVGMLSKKLGCEALTISTSNGDLTTKNIKTVIGDEDSLSLITNDGIYDYSPQVDQWVRSSEIFESAKINTKFLSKSDLNQAVPDSDYNSELNMMVTVFKEAQLSSLGGLTIPKLTIVLEDCTTGFKKVARIDILNSEIYSVQKVMLVPFFGEPRILLFSDTGITHTLSFWTLDKNLNFVRPVTVLESIATPIDRTKWKIDVCRDGDFVYLAFCYEKNLKLRLIDFNGVVQSTKSHTLTNRLGNTSNVKGLGFSICLSPGLVNIVFCSSELNTFGTTSLVAIGFTRTLFLAVSESVVNDIFVCFDVSVVSSPDGQFLTAAVQYLNNLSGENPMPSQVKYIKLTSDTVYSFEKVNEDFAARRVGLLSRPFFIDDKPYVLAKCVEFGQPTGFLLGLYNNKFISNFSPFSLSEDRTLNEPIFTGTANAITYNGIVYSAVEKQYGLSTNDFSLYSFSAFVAVAKLTIDFTDTPDAGTVSKIGETLYYTNGPTIALDKRGPYESGFNIRPSIKTVLTSTATTGTPAISNKTFTYFAVYEFYNSVGELERSIPSTGFTLTTPANTIYMECRVRNLTGTFKVNFDSTKGTSKYTPFITIYRTTHQGSIPYKIGSKEAWTYSEHIDLYDAATDGEIQNNEILYTNGGVIESDSTPNAKFSTAGGNRQYLGGLEDDDEIAYSIKQLYGEAVSHSDFFRIRISSATSADKTKMSGLGFLDGKLIIGRKNSLYFIAGDGPLLTGKDNTFTEPEIISSDTGIEDPRSVLNIPLGLLFKSKKGIYLLDRGLNVSYIGAPVDEFNGERIVSAFVSDTMNEARFNTDAGNCLVYNYTDNKWSVYRNQTQTWASIWNGSPVQLLNGKVVVEKEGLFQDDGAFYPLRHTTSWLKMNLIQGALRIWRILLIGEYKSAHTLVLRAYYDYDDTVYDEYEYVHNAASPVFQWRVHLKKQVCQAIKLEIFDKNQSGTGESFTLSNIQAEVGIKNGSAKLGQSKTN